MLTGPQLDRIRRLALRFTGIELTARHGTLLERRVPRLEPGGLLDVDVLLEAAERGDPDGRRRFIAWVTTRYTGFFRNPEQFGPAVARAEDAVRRRGCARLWSAGTSTGEEAYSLAWATREVEAAGSSGVSILATDIDEGALAVARLGRYAEASVQELELSTRAELFEATERAGVWQVRPAIRARVQFRCVNLVDLVWPVSGFFDVIFCRNVLMYFEASYRYAVLERLASHLSPDALLVLDPSEHLGRAGPLFQSQGPGLWVRRPVAGSRLAPTGRRLAGTGGVVS